MAEDVSAYYWSTALGDPELAPTYRMLEGCTDTGGGYRMLVPKDWCAISPVPRVGPAGFAVHGVVWQSPGNPRSGRLVVLGLPPDAGFFAAEILETLAGLDGLEVEEELPHPNTTLGKASSDDRVAYFAVTRTDEGWLALIAEAARDQADAEPHLRASTATFQARAE